MIFDNLPYLAFGFFFVAKNLSKCNVIFYIYKFHGVYFLQNYRVSLENTNLLKCFITFCFKNLNKLC